jgi:hypothetical protein
VIYLDEPEPKSVCILTCETLGEARSGSDFEIVQNDNRAHRRLIERKKERVFALRGVGGTIDENQMRPLQTEKRFALRRNIKGFDRPKPIPTASQRDDFGVVRITFGHPILEPLCSR